VELFEAEVVRVDVIAGLDGGARAADGLAVADDHFAGLDGAERDFVARGNGVARGELDAIDA